MIHECARWKSAAQVSLSSDDAVQDLLHGAHPDFEQLRGLTEISRAFTYTTTLDQVTRLTVERGAALLGATAAVVMLPDDEGLMHVRAAHGVEEHLITRFRAPFSDELLGRLQGLFSVGEDRFLAVPLVVGGAVSGLVAVATDSSASPGDEWLLSALADHAAVALENARLGGEVRMAMEERLRASEGATSAKDRALSTLAHDIRTPLGAIEGYCDIMEMGMQGPINEQQRETLARIRMSGRHLLSLLDTVMDIARLDAGALHVTNAPVRLSDVVREAVQLLIPAADAKLQQLRIGQLSDVIVLADHNRLRQVLVNLLGNAVKFTPEGGAITVSTETSLTTGKTSGVVRVQDSGPGIAPDEQAAIFEAYYRSNAAAHTPGVGLGLAISQALIAQMDGALTLVSELGVGSIFTVTLPAS
jgi:sigma-B regulation protein RsbU (phosphoserine phosphatase)